MYSAIYHKIEVGLSFCYLKGSINFKQNSWETKFEGKKLRSKVEFSGFVHCALELFIVSTLALPLFREFKSTVTLKTESMFDSVSF